MCIVAVVPVLHKEKKSDMKQKMCHATIHMVDCGKKKERSPILPVTPPAERN